MTEPDSIPASQSPGDLDRLRDEYVDRARRLAQSDLYSPFNAAHLLLVQQRQRVALKLLRRHGFYPWTTKRILEVGCGGGSILHEYLGFGVAPERIHGLDVLSGRLAMARSWLPHLSLTHADGQRLPYAPDSFDLVLQHTAFSSILDEDIRINVAREMLRVLRRPSGLILWYDFWLNPANSNAHGLRPPEIRRLFPNCSFDFNRITLAPPISRRLASVSWVLSVWLESLRVFNTHYLVAIQVKAS